MKDLHNINSILYFIALIPNEQLREEVKMIKEIMSNEYGASHALKSPAHITMQMPFKRSIADESEIISALEKFAVGEIPFMVELDGYGAFPPRVIYIKVTNPQPIALLHGRIKKLLADSLGFTREEIMQHVQPHITVATRDLTREAFEDAWPVMESREFDGSFTVSSIFLLKHNGRHWDILREFPFGRR